MSTQLVSYIAPSAPATRRPALGNEPFLRPEIGFTPAWYRQHLEIDFGQRWHTDVDYRRDTVIAMRAELRRRFPGSAIGGIDRADAPLDLLTGVFGGTPVAAIFGLPVVYAAGNWPNVEHHYLSQAEMAALEMPDLARNPFLTQLLAQVDRIIALEGRCEGFINWQGVLNTAQRLRGPDLFLDLYEAPEACHRFFRIITDVMLEATRCLREKQHASGADYRFATVSNCSVNMISPEQYADFLLPCDRRIAAAFDLIGIHNCAWTADPYLDHYASIPNLGYIDMGINSYLSRARRLMPEARRAIMYTPMDLANKNENEIRADFERIARDYAPCDIVMADIEAGTPDGRVRFALELCETLSTRSCSAATAG
jgi:uroporphyrinogen-III decarboxylase